MCCEQKTQWCILNKLQEHLITLTFIFLSVLWKSTTLKTVLTVELLLQGNVNWNQLLITSESAVVKHNFIQRWACELHNSWLNWAQILSEYWHLAFEECICLAHIFLILFIQSRNVLDGLFGVSWSLIGALQYFLPWWLELEIMQTRPLLLLQFPNYEC